MTESKIPPLAVITCATPGIGRVTVDLLANEDWSVVVLEIAEAEDWSTADVRTVVADLRNAEDAIEHEIEPGRRIDALFNVAGMYRDTTPEDFELESGLDILRANLRVPPRSPAGSGNGSPATAAS